MSKLKNKLKEYKMIYKIYMFLYGERKEKKRIAMAKDELQKNGFNYVKIIEEALDRSGAKFFLDFGSLLGIIRDGSFMSWDMDIDYGIYINADYTWSDLEKTMYNINFSKVRQFTHNGQITEQTYGTGLLTIDFFKHCEDVNNSYEYLYFKKEGFEYKSLFDFHVSKLKLYKFSDIKKITINGVEVSVPNEIDKYLASIYTENWRVPDTNWSHANGCAWHELPDVIGTAEFL